MLGELCECDAGRLYLSSVENPSSALSEDPSGGPSNLHFGGSSSFFETVGRLKPSCSIVQGLWGSG